MQTETAPEKAVGNDWANWLEMEIPRLHFEQNNINEHEIWKNAIHVETLAGNYSR
ncbi:MAG: hypothetical protein ACREFE_02645 [Limisphaerales bacterium]